MNISANFHRVKAFTGIVYTKLSDDSYAMRIEFVDSSRDTGTISFFSNKKEDLETLFQINPENVTFEEKGQENE